MFSGGNVPSDIFRRLTDPFITKNKKSQLKRAAQVDLSVYVKGKKEIAG